TAARNRQGVAKIAYIEKQALRGIGVIENPNHLQFESSRVDITLEDDSIAKLKIQFLRQVFGDNTACSFRKESFSLSFRHLQLRSKREERIRFDAEPGEEILLIPVVLIGSSVPVPGRDFFHARHSADLRLVSDQD